MKDIVFATNNKHKLIEIRNIVKDKINILSLKDINCYEELEETGETLEANASQKANYVYNNYHIDCFADDTGLEVFALDGKPGVYSARYAGESKSFDDNINKILEELKGIDNRRARFRTVVSLILDGKVHLFEGRVDGIITNEKRGTNGFGYDPVFMPDGFMQTFAEMTDEQKNNISHRYFAMDKMLNSGYII